MKKFKRKINGLKKKALRDINEVNFDEAQEKYEKGKKAFQSCHKIFVEKMNETDLGDDIKEKFLRGVSQIGGLGARSSGALTSFLADAELLRHLETLTKSASTFYDKALDSEYLKTHIGGGNHRLFDGGHDIFNAWDRAKDALPDDSFQEEVIGYVSALWKDLSTVKGLPFMTVSYDSYNDWANSASEWIPGVDKKYFYDLLSFDAYELLSTGLSSVSIIFALKKEDEEKLAEILGSMGIVSILSANPIMGLLVIGTSAFAYTKKKMEFDKTAFGKSVIMTSSSMALFSILGLPILFELVIIGVVTRQFRKEILDNDELLLSIKNKLESTLSRFKAKAS